MEVFRLSDRWLASYRSPDLLHHLEFPMLVGDYVAWYTGNVSSVMDLRTGRAFDVHGSVAANDGLVAMGESVGPLARGQPGQIRISVLPVDTISSMAPQGCG